ncbi:MAG: thioesterase family protein [Bacteroidota bacterium]
MSAVLEGYNYYHEMRIRWAEVDAQNVVFNGNYMTYLDVAITEYWRARGIVYPDGFSKYDSDLFVKKATIEYHQPAIFDDLIRVYVRCGRIGKTSMQFLFEIVKDEDTHLISGELIYVNVDPKDNRPSPVPAPLRELFLSA